ncbi:O-antigen ligase [Peptoclostridium litorale DSM 5388]|uniref:Polysaccharide polymerase n=1 Tax=Peptoclostridium litorale DSM 5388 TaxID=1121324 RepID=A0A069RCZ9_PEPLI|nr:O-antigen ligase family protein [Peptoclostridium litorale]KDR94618.1 polysaccharide polymerase [Peptoclostridium litorale DSM 5388]SIO30742.1 O-antigen ligase [Peptoclostridium litorale DSM 5388]
MVNGYEVYRGKGFKVILLFLMMVGIYFQKFYVYAGMAIKPYMFALALILAYFIFYGLDQEIIKRTYSYEALFAIFTVYAIWRGYFSRHSMLSVRATMALLIVIVMYIFVSSMAFSMSNSSILRLLYVSGTIFLAASLFLYLKGKGVSDIGGVVDRDVYRLTGSIDDPNVFGIFASLIYAFSFHNMISGEKKYIISFFLAFTCIVLSESRGAFLAVLAFHIMYFVKIKDTRAKSFAANILIIGAVAAGGHYWLQTADVSIGSAVQTRLLDTTGSTRVYIWTDAIEIFKEYPLIGVGLNNFRPYNNEIFADTHLMHNIFLEVIVEQGIAGATVFFAALIMLVLKKDNSEIEKIIKMVICMQLIMLFFLSGFFNEFTFLTLALYKAAAVKGENEDEAMNATSV